MNLLLAAVLAFCLAVPSVSPGQGFPPTEYTPPSGPATDAATQSEIFELAETVARVGNQHIFRGDLVGDANILMIPALERMSPEERAAADGQIKAQRERLVQQALREAVQRKLMFEMFLQTIPPDKLKEAKANINERVGDQFSEALDEMLEKLQKADPTEAKDLARQSSQLFRLAMLMQELEITTYRDLDRLLRKYGSSLDKQQQVFAEDQLGRQEMYKEARNTGEVTYDDMVAYYRDHIDDFQVARRARWEQITIKFSRFPSRFAAGEAIAKIGNELFYGAPFKQVAKRSSQGDNADEGGYQDWTDWGSFKISREINDAVFSIEPGVLSHIIEDVEGLHIVRVIERQEAHVIPFLDAQLTIKERIRNDRRTDLITKYLADLQERIPVWTIYDEPASPGAIANPPSANQIR